MIAAAAVGAVATRPASSRAAALAVALAVADLPLVGAGAALTAGSAVAPLVMVLGAGLMLARGAAAGGFVEGACTRLVRLSGGSSRRLFLLTCMLAAFLTATVTLDGAIVLIVPIVARLRPSRPLLLGAVATVNTFSLALPEGNPTNLIVLQHLGLSFRAALERTIPAGLIAALICTAAVAFAERHALTGPAQLVSEAPSTATAGVGVGTLLRATTQVSALLVVLLPIAPSTHIDEQGLVGMLAVGLGMGIIAAAINNLPASVIAAGTLTGHAGYAALAGLSIGALATPQGSVATMLAGDGGYIGWFAPAAFLAVAIAAILMAFL